MLDTLTAKLVERISGLDKRTLSSLRLVCRALYEKTTAGFGRAWFGLVETDLSDGSLRRLEALAGHEIFRHSVLELHIVRAMCEDTDHSRDASRMVLDDRCPDALPSPRDFSSVAVVRNFQDMLRRLANCNTVEIYDRPDRYPDLNGVAVGLAPTNVLCLVLSAIATGSRPIQTLRIRFRKKTGYGFARQLPSIAIPSDTFPSLQDLDIQWTVGDYDRELALALIMSAPCLQRLSLGFGPYGDAGSCWRRLAEAPTLPPITHLCFTAARDLPCVTVASVILRLRESLRSLTFHLVGLYDGNWSSLFGEMLRHDFPCLGRIELGLVRAGYPSIRRDQARVCFCPLRLDKKALSIRGGRWEFFFCRNREGRCTGGARFKGSRAGMKFALEALADESHCLITHPEGPSRSGLPSSTTFTGDGVGCEETGFDGLIQTWNDQMNIH